MVVQIIVCITGNLLALAADTTIVVLERVLVRVRMEEDTGILVPDSNGIVVTNLCSTGQETFDVVHS